MPRSQVARLRSLVRKITIYQKINKFPEIAILLQGAKTDLEIALRMHWSLVSNRRTSKHRKIVN